MKRLTGALLAIALIATAVFGSTTATIFAESTAESFRVVGYYSGDLFNEPVGKLQTKKMTHIMYAFLIPNIDGTVKPLKKPEQLAAVVEQAHRDGCKVYIALGGWSYEGKPIVGTFETLAADDKLRKKLVDEVVKFTLENQLDGVEIDWEHPNANTIKNYEKLVVQLSAALRKEGKQLTAAVNGAWSTTAGPEVSKLMTDKALNSFEFISVMGYDMNNQEHSPLWFGNTSIDYWLNRGVAAEKIVLGMPLYGRPSWKQYRHLVEADSANAYKDFVAGTPEQATANGNPGDSYYNGLNTLREKTRLALQKAGGVMLFDVNEDVDWTNPELAPYSAVSMIDETIRSVKGLSRAEIKDYVTVVLDNQVVSMWATGGEAIAFIDENNRTMVPMRKLLEAMKADQIQWVDETKTATAVKGGITVTATIGEPFIVVNGQERAMDTKAILKDGKTYLPARPILEAFGYTMKWSNASKTVYGNK